jgi:hypothetical protein
MHHARSVAGTTIDCGVKSKVDFLGLHMRKTRTHDLLNAASKDMCQKAQALGLSIQPAVYELDQSNPHKSVIRRVG